MKDSTYDELKKVKVCVMEHSGYKAALMQAERLVGDHVFGLPPGRSIGVIPIDCLPGCPDAWVRGAGTYVCPVNTEKGLWFDWTMNDNDTAIIPSVKAMNPITGEKINDLKMEQYRDKCPKHGIELAHGRFCDKCGYNLPPQNYVSYPNTLWWDGFRQADGTVRQFFFTEDDKRDIASLVIGKENTVPAFGFAFFKTKVTRFVAPLATRGLLSIPGSGVFFESAPTWTVTDGADCILSDDSVTTNYCMDTSSLKLGCMMGKSDETSTSATYATNSSGEHVKCSTAGISKSFKSTLVKKMKVNSTASGQSRSIKDVSVGAGAKINQKLDVDKLALEEYIATPQAIIRLYFVFDEQLEAIFEKGGIKELKGKDEGYMEKLPVG